MKIGRKDKTADMFGSACRKKQYGYKRKAYAAARQIICSGFRRGVVGLMSEGGLYGLTFLHLSL